MNLDKEMSLWSQQVADLLAEYGLIDLVRHFRLGLAQAIRAVDCGGFDVMLLTETKIQSEAYLQNRLVYDVTCSVARLSRDREAQGVVEMVKS